MTADTPRRRPGRPPKSASDDVSTRDRLIAATIEHAVEVGVDQVTLSGVARRAGFSTPAIYSHFDSRTDLLIAALGRRLGELDLDLSDDPVERVVSWMRHPDPSARRFLVEVYVAAMRDDELGELLREYQTTTTERFLARGPIDRDRFAALSLLLLGGSMIDAIDALDADAHTLDDAIRRMVRSLLDD